MLRHFFLAIDVNNRCRPSFIYLWGRHFSWNLLTMIHLSIFSWSMLVSHDALITILRIAFSPMGQSLMSFETHKANGKPFIFDDVDEVKSWLFELKRGVHMKITLIRPSLKLESISQTKKGVQARRKVGIWALDEHRAKLWDSYFSRTLNEMSLGYFHEFSNTEQRPNPMRSNFIFYLWNLQEFHWHNNFTIECTYLVRKGVGTQN